MRHLKKYEKKPRIMRKKAGTFDKNGSFFGCELNVANRSFFVCFTYFIVYILC